MVHVPVKQLWHLVLGVETGCHTCCCDKTWQLSAKSLGNFLKKESGGQVGKTAALVPHGPVDEHLCGVLLIRLLVTLFHHNYYHILCELRLHVAGAVRFRQARPDLDAFLAQQRTELIDCHGFLYNQLPLRCAERAFGHWRHEGASRGRDQNFLGMLPQLGQLLCSSNRAAPHPCRRER